jgi:predicted amidohydrolase
VSKIGFAQYDVEFGEYDHNTATISRLAAAASDADLLVFPELGLTGYEFKDAREAERYAEPFGAGPTSETLKRLSVKHKTTLVIGYPEYTTKGCYNSAMLATPDGGLHNYRKLHLFSRETELFTPGTDEPPVIDTPAGRIGLMICFDWIFPETARMLAVKGAQIIAHPSNLVLQWCQRAMFCRCLENAVFAVTANRIGTEERAGRKLRFTGASQVVDPKGEVVLNATEAEEFVGVVEVDPSKADDKHITPYNHLIDDRRPEHYGVLAQGQTQTTLV